MFIKKREFINGNTKTNKYYFLGLRFFKKKWTPEIRKTYIFNFVINKKINTHKKTFCHINNSVLPKSKRLNFGRVAFIAELSLPQCTLYRVKNKIEALENLGYKVDLCAWNQEADCMKILQTADFVIFYRVPFFDNVKRYYEEANRLGLYKIFDIDDLIFDRHLYEQYLNNTDFSVEQKKSLLFDCDLYLKSLQASDEFWGSTQKLVDIAKKYIKTVNVVPNCIPNKLKDVYKFKCNKKNAEKIKIFYGSGTTTHDDDFKNCANALNKILKKYKNTELYIVGHLKTDSFKGVKDRVHRLDFINSDDYYFSLLDYDISVAPLSQNTFNVAKSNIKYIEASVLGIPSVVSPLPEFTYAIKNGQNGFVAKTEQDWFKSIEKLVCDQTLRQKIGLNAKKTVNSLYSFESNCKYVKNALQKCLSNKPSKSKRILYVNVLYGYSSFGGATVVAEQIAEKLQQNYKDYEPYVFALHTQQNITSFVRYDWNNIPVFSVFADGISWNSHNENITQEFRKILDIVQPDIVHFHCVQTLGIDSVSECRKRNIPYVVTLHDAWWVCPRQFMLDTNNKFCNQYKCDANICKERCGISHADFYKRKHEMCEVLKYASYVCTPSDIFTKQIEQNFPFLKIGFNTNGIILPKNSNKNRSNKKIVFGYFGGKYHVKGYYFIRDILLKYPNKNWKLVMIDTGSKFGFHSMSVDEWPGCDVEILGYTPHEEMENVYKKINVLLFPSEWKESFGLMVREAIANDVFVVSSECGGPVEAIVPNENGLVFERENETELKKCLDYVFEHEQEILKYKTKNFGDVRSFDVQTAELHGIYDKIWNDKKRCLF